MVPFLRSPKQVLMAGLLWIPVIAWVVTLLVFLVDITWVEATVWGGPPMVIHFFISISLWYLCRMTFKNRWPLIKTIWIHLLAAAMISTIWLTIVWLYSELLAQISGITVWTSRFSRAVPVFAAVAVSIYFITILGHYLILVSEHRREAEKEALKQKLLAGQAEIKALKATIHPHFLFNSLHLLPPLMASSQQRAVDVVTQLADFLLYSLQYGKQETVTLRQELEHIKNYLGIESTRLGERLKLTFTVDNSLLEIPIPPLSLLPLAENAIKHGINQCLDGGVISLTIRRVAQQICITMTNPWEEPSRPLEGQGLGLTTLKERFRARYGPAGSLITRKNGHFFQVDLCLPYPMRG